MGLRWIRICAGSGVARPGSLILDGRSRTLVGSSRVVVMGDTAKTFFGLDLCSGTGSASAGWRARGWRVVTLDLDARFKPDIVADLRRWSWKGSVPDLLWISPPCDEFAREGMPWCATGRDPDLSIFEAARRLVWEIRPRAWIIENVKSAQRWVGAASCHVGAFFFWTNLHLAELQSLRVKPKSAFGSNQAVARARIPLEISLSVARTVEQQGSLFDVWAKCRPKKNLL